MQLAVALDYIDHALMLAQQRGEKVAVAVVDAGGHLVAFKKDDGTQLGSIDLAILKARTAVLFQRPTEDMENALHAGKTMIASLPNVLPAGGGVPIIVNGMAIGAIGLSGGEGETDARLAEGAVNKATSS